MKGTTTASTSERTLECTLEGRLERRRVLLWLAARLG